MVEMPESRQNINANHIPPTRLDEHVAFTVTRLSIDNA